MTPPGQKGLGRMVISSMYTYIILQYVVSIWIMKQRAITYDGISCSCREQKCCGLLIIDCKLDGQMVFDLFLVFFSKVL